MRVKPLFLLVSLSSALGMARPVSLAGPWAEGIRPTEVREIQTSAKAGGPALMQAEKEIKITIDNNGGEARNGFNMPLTGYITDTTTLADILNGYEEDGFLDLVKTDSEGKEIDLFGFTLNDGKEIYSLEEIKGMDITEETTIKAYWDDMASKYAPLVEDLVKYVGMAIDRNEVLDAVKVPELPDGQGELSKEFKYGSGQYIPDGSKEEDSFAKVLVSYPDGSEAEVTVNIKVLAEAKEVTVRLDPNGGIIPASGNTHYQSIMPKTMEVKKLGEHLFENDLLVPSKKIGLKDIEFLGWKRVSDGKIFATDDLRGMIFTEDTTFVAQWDDMATKYEPVAEKIVKTLGEELTEAEIFGAVSVPDYPADLAEPVKEFRYQGQSLPEGSKEEEKTSYVKVTYEDGSSDTVGVKISYIAEAEKPEPEEPLTEDIKVRFSPNGGLLKVGGDLTTAYTIAKDKEVKTLDDYIFDEGLISVSKKVGEEEIEFKGWKRESDGKVFTEDEIKELVFTEDTHFIAQWDELASEYAPEGGELNKTVGMEISLEEILDKVSVPGYPEDLEAPSKALKYEDQELPDGSKETVFTVVVEVSYPDGSKADAQVVINVEAGEPEKPETDEVSVSFNPNGGLLKASGDLTLSFDLTKGTGLEESVFTDGDLSVSKKAGGEELEFKGWKRESDGKVFTEEEIKELVFTEDTTFIAQWPEMASEYAPVAEEIKKNLGEPTTREEVLDAVSIPNYPADAEQPTKELKYGETNLPDGSKEEIYSSYVEVTYPDGSVAEVRVPVNYMTDEKEPEEPETDEVSVRFNPNGGLLKVGGDLTLRFDLTKGTGLEESVFADGDLSVSKKVDGEELEFKGWKRESDGKVFTEEELKDLTFTEDTTFIAQWPEMASEYGPVAEEIKKTVGEAVTAEEVLDAVSIPGYPEDEQAPSKKLTYGETNLPDTNDGTGIYYSYVTVSYPDGSTAQIEVPINVAKGEEPGKPDPEPTPDPDPEKPDPEPTPDPDPEKPDPTPTPDPKPEKPSKPSKPSRPSNPSKPSPSLPDETEKPSKPEAPKDEAKLDVSRLAGEDRIGTAIKLSKEYFDSADTLIIADAGNFPDAMVASALAGQLDSPILLTSTAKLDSRLVDEIKRLGAKDLILVGGENSISEEVRKELESFDKDGVERIAGENRYETSAKIARRLAEEGGRTDKALVVSGEVFVDALSAGPLASREGMPILLASSNEVPEVILELIDELGISNVSLVGGNSSLPKSLEKDLPKVEERFAGDTRFETAISIAEKEFSDSNKIFLANGEHWMDALVVGPVAGKLDMPVLLSGANKAPESLSDYIEREKIKSIVIVGGPNMISQDLLDELSK